MITRDGNVEKFPEILGAILSKFPVSMTMETKQYEEISSARNIELFWCNFQKILRKFQHKAFRLMFFAKLS